MKSDILSPILNSPKLPTYFAQIQQFIADEAQKRTEFYNLISEKEENMKVVKSILNNEISPK